MLYYTVLVPEQKTLSQAEQDFVLGEKMRDVKICCVQ